MIAKIQLANLRFGMNAEVGITNFPVEKFPKTDRLLAPVCREMAI
jgi:hypothetical protein